MAAVAIAAFLGLAPTLWAQQQSDVAPFSVIGNVGVGYSYLKEGNTFTHTTSLASGDVDVSGYWRDPRIVLYDVSSYAGYGSAIATGADIGNRGDGVNATAYLLGGGHFPVTINYDKQWVNSPGFSSNGNVLGSLSTSFRSTTLGIDSGLFWGKLPPINLHYGQGSSNTGYSGMSQGGGSSYRAFAVDTRYSLFRWNLSGSYNFTTNNSRSVYLLSSTGVIAPETTDSGYLILQAEKHTQKQSVNIVGGSRTWNDNLNGYKTDTSYDYLNIGASARPSQWLSLGVTGGWDSDVASTQVQQLLGVQGSASTISGTLQSSTGGLLTAGGTVEARLPRGFALNGDVTYGKTSGSGEADTTERVEDAYLNYIYHMRRGGVVTATGGYQESSNGQDGASSNTSNTKLVRGSYTNVLPYRVNFTGSTSYGQRDYKNVYQSATVSSPGHYYNFMLSGTRPLTERTKLTAEFSYDDNVNEYPIHYETRNKGFGLRLDSGDYQVSLHRHYQEGLARQVGNGLVYVTNSQEADLSPLVATLSMSSTVQTAVTGSWELNRKRIRIWGNWVRYDYSNQSSQGNGADLFNIIATYKLRLLKVKAGYYQSSSHAIAYSNLKPLENRQIFIEVIRHFGISK